MMFNLGYPRLAMFKNMKACIDDKNCLQFAVNMNYCSHLLVSKYDIVDFITKIHEC